MRGAATYAQRKYYHENRVSIVKDALADVDWMTVLYRACFTVAAVIYAALSVLYFISGGWAGFLFGFLFMMFTGLFITFAIS